MNDLKPPEDEDVDDGGFPKSKWRLWLLIALFFFFPMVLRPWWLALLCISTYGLLVWLIYPKRKPK